MAQINVSVDKEVIYKHKKSTGLEFAVGTGYNFYPATLFFNKSGDIKYASLGYKSEEEFLVLLQYIHTNSFKKMSLKSYKKSINYIKKNNDEIIDERKHDR